MESAPPRAEIPVLAELPLVISCSKFTLRPVTVADADDLWPHVSNPELSQFMSWGPHASREVTSGFLQAQVDALAKGTILNWAIELEGKARGLVALAGITWRFSTDWRVDRAELGYWIGQPYWGQGVMTEATLHAMKFAFETLGLHKVTVGHMEGNEPSKRIIEGLGFRYVGVQLEDAWKHHAWQDHHRYELTAGEWSDSARTMRFRKLRLP